MKSPRKALSRGFTLIELMIVVSIIGILSSVAIPTFRQMNDRAKAGERKAVLRTVRNALEQQHLKDGSFGAGFTGAWNPTGTPGNLKRAYSQTLPGWSKLDVTIDGGLYYSYAFVAGEPAAPAVPYFTILVQGDVDQNGELYSATYTYEMNNGAFLQTTDDPPGWYEENVF